MPSRVLSEMSRRSEVADGAEDVEHELAGGRGGVEALLEADQVDAAGLESVDGFEQLPERAAESVEADDAQPVTRVGACSMSSVRPGRSNRLPEMMSVNTRDGAGLDEADMLGVGVLVAGRDAGVAKGVAGASRHDRIKTGRFRDGLGVHSVSSVTRG